MPRPAKKRHAERHRGIEDERPRERRSTSVSVGNPSEEQRAREHAAKPRCDERRKRGWPKTRRRKQPLAIEPERDVRRHEEIVCFEPAARANACDQAGYRSLHEGRAS